MQLDFTTFLASDVSLWASPLLPARFWAKVNQHGPLPEHCPELGPCWVWTASCIPQGYGHFWADGRLVSAHRISYATLVGPIPEGLHVLHHCDNPPCVRPIHLFTGTRADNMADMIRKGRKNPARGERNGQATHPERTARGECHGSAKLTAADVLEIRQLAREGLTQRAIASRFGVSHILVGGIIRRKIWAHI